MRSLVARDEKIIQPKQTESSNGKTKLSLNLSVVLQKGPNIYHGDRVRRRRPLAANHG